MLDRRLIAHFCCWRVSYPCHALPAVNHRWSVEPTLQGPYVVFTSAALARHSCAYHANPGMPGDRGWLQSTRPVILSSWLFRAFPMVDIFRWQFTCDAKAHCVYLQVFIHMPPVYTPVSDRPILFFPYCWPACQAICHCPRVHIYFNLGQ